MNIWLEIIKKFVGKYWYLIVIFLFLAYISIMKYQIKQKDAQIKQITAELTLRAFEAQKAKESLENTLKRRELENKVLTELEKQNFDLNKKIQNAKDSYNEKNGIVDNFNDIVSGLWAETNASNPKN